MSLPSDGLVPVFDGHQDILSCLNRVGGVSAAGQFSGPSEFHIDQTKCRAGAWCGGMFALWVPSLDLADDLQEQMLLEAYDLPLPEALEQNSALQVVTEQIAILHRLQDLDALLICTSADTLEEAFDGPSLAAVCHLEGCDAIDPEFAVLESLYDQGLRSLGLVWSRPTIFGHGVPFRFPSSPDTGPGLTEDGLELVRFCNSKQIMLDLSHLNQAGFEDVARHSTQPLVASHSNVHALCPHSRNLTDAQLEAMAASQGLAGVNFACAFLREDGRMLADTSVDHIIRHMDYLLGKLGERGVGIGSDFDGAMVPESIGDAAGLPILIQAMRDAGYGQELIERICFRNWLDVLARTWWGNDG